MFYSDLFFFEMRMQNSCRILTQQLGTHRGPTADPLAVGPPVGPQWVSGGSGGGSQWVWRWVPVGLAVGPSGSPVGPAVGPSGSGGGSQWVSGGSLWVPCHQYAVEL